MVDAAAVAGPAGPLGPLGPIGPLIAPTLQSVAVSFAAQARSSPLPEALVVALVKRTAPVLVFTQLCTCPAVPLCACTGAAAGGPFNTSSIAASATTAPARLERVRD